MRILNAAGFLINPAMVLGAQIRAIGKPASARAHSAQILAWAQCAILAGTIEFRPDQFPDLTTKLTMGGLPLESDDSLPAGTVEFRDAEGHIVSRIENLAIPIASPR